MYGGIKSKKCCFCEKEITVNNYKKHIEVCETQSKIVKKIRGLDYDPNHGFKDKSRIAWNKGLKKETSIVLMNVSEQAKKDFESGKRKLFGYAAWSREERSKRAKEQNFGGYREKAGRSKKFYIEDSFGKVTCLQSTYEYRFYLIIQKENIKWIRPKALKYDNRLYFPDFFLVDYNLYIDTKNNFKAKLDEEKIKKVRRQNEIVLDVILESDIINYEKFGYTRKSEK